MPWASHQGSEAGCGGGVGMVGVTSGWWPTGHREPSRGSGLHRWPAGDLWGAASRAGLGHLSGDPAHAGHAQRPHRTVGDGETVSGYPPTAQRPSVPGGGKADLGGLQQVQAAILGTARPPQLPHIRPSASAAEVRLTARRKRCGAARPAASRSLGRELRLRHPQTRAPLGVVPVHSFPDLSSGRRRPRPVWCPEAGPPPLTATLEIEVKSDGLDVTLPAQARTGVT